MTAFKALRVIEENNQFNLSISQRNIDDLPQHGVLIRVHYSALNYKDGLSASGHRGITRKFPHTPGIDAVGVVEVSQSEQFKPGDEVIVTGYDLGMNTDGGFAQYINVPADWIVPKPSSLSFFDSMVLGTAGFTAAIALYRMLKNDQSPHDGPILVTGASGGVGSLAVALLAKAGFEVLASSGKTSAIDYLKSLGAKACINREEVLVPIERLLVKPRWAGAVDTVGGETLNSILKACKPWGNVAVCGLVGSPELHTTVYPFILNGINILGVNSSDTPMSLRQEIWNKLSNEWALRNLKEMAKECSLEELPVYIDHILKGQTQGRIIVNCQI